MSTDQGWLSMTCPELEAECDRLRGEAAAALEDVRTLQALINLRPHWRDSPATTLLQLLADDIQAAGAVPC